MWQLVVFFMVASRASQHNIFWRIRTATDQGNNVLNVAVFFNRASAIIAEIVLCLQLALEIGCRKNAIRHRFSRSSIASAYAAAKSAVGALLIPTMVFANLFFVALTIIFDTLTFALGIAPVLFAVSESNNISIAIAIAFNFGIFSFSVLGAIGSQVGTTLFFVALNILAVASFAVGGQSIFAGSLPIKIIRGGWQRFAAFRTCFVRGIHSISPLLSRLMLASGSASDCSSGATLDAFYIIPQAVH
jgi:hypothetical protein